MKLAVLRLRGRRCFNVSKQPGAPAAPTVTRMPLAHAGPSDARGFVATMVLVELPAVREKYGLGFGDARRVRQRGRITMDFEGKPTATYKTGETFSLSRARSTKG